MVLKSIKQKVFQVSLSGFLACGVFAFSTATTPMDVQAGPETATEMKTFIDNLNSEMENYLKDYLNRNKVGFTAASKQTGNISTLSVPSYIDRETVFSVKLTTYPAEKKIAINGNVLTNEEKLILNKVAKKAFPNYQIINNIAFFPYNIHKPYAIEIKPYSNLYVKPGDKDLATQVLIGTPLKILEISQDKKFACVQSEDDKYIAWIPMANILQIDQKKWNEWKNSRNTIVTQNITKPAQLYFGSILPATTSTTNKNMLNVSLPAGKTITLPKTNFTGLDKMNSEVGKLIKTANSYLATGQKGKTTYLWGGTVGNDLDCSGFNQTVFRSVGMLLPRDADQQQHFTRPVATNLSKINELKPGDLLFFSENKQYATHTGVYTGNNKFIHSSSGGPYRGVKVNTLKGGSEYDKKLQQMYFGGGRVQLKNLFM